MTSYLKQHIVLLQRRGKLKEGEIHGLTLLATTPTLASNASLTRDAVSHIRVASDILRSLSSGVHPGETDKFINDVVAYLQYAIAIDVMPSRWQKALPPLQPWWVLEQVGFMHEAILAVQQQEPSFRVEEKTSAECDGHDADADTTNMWLQTWVFLVCLTRYTEHMNATRSVAAVSHKNH